MTDPSQLISQLAALADDLGPLAIPDTWQDQLASICATAQLALGAAAVSIARVDDLDGESGLRYVAAHGEGADAIVGTWLPAGTGLAGYVAVSGQSLAIDRVRDDPRFAADVAESTGYVPTSLLAVPVVSSGGDLLGVLSVLDRGNDAHGTSADALQLATAFAAQAALVLPRVDLLARLGPLLVDALARTVGERDVELSDALRSLAAELDEPDGELAATAALLAELRTRGPEARARVERVLAELLALTEPRRRR